MQLIQLVKREIKLVYHKLFDMFNILIFFVIISFSFSFALGASISLQMATSIILVCFMLSSNLSTHFIFEKEIESGLLQQLYISVNSLNNLIFSKIIAQFLCFGLPLSLVIPVAAIFFNVSFEDIAVLIFIMLITSLILSSVNVMMAGITSGLRSGTIVSLILSVPLYIPMIVLNLSYIESRATGGELTLITFIESSFAFALIVLPLTIFSVRQTLRNAISE